MSINYLLSYTFIFYMFLLYIYRWDNLLNVFNFIYLNDVA